MVEMFSHHGPYLVSWVLLMVGLGVIMTSHHLLRRLIGLYLVQTSVIMFFIALGVKSGGTVPILYSHGPVEAGHSYANPLPHVLMLTAIVVGISTQGVALMLLKRLYRAHHTLQDDQLRARVSST